jgi:hypothetical protein
MLCCLWLACLVSAVHAAAVPVLFVQIAVVPRGAVSFCVQQSGIIALPCLVCVLLLAVMPWVHFIKHFLS